MKQINGFRSEPRQRSNGQLPAGPYVGKIKNVKIDGQEPDQTLILRLDVSEGEHAEYYTNRYIREDLRYKNKESKYPAKYKGDLRIRIPNPDNKKAMYPESDLANFNDAIWCIEESNPGYHWDWDEKSLVGLVVGFSVRQGTYNDKAFTKIVKLESAPDVRMGKIEVMEPMAPRSDAAEPYMPPVDQQTGFQQVSVNDDELPF